MFSYDEFLFGVRGEVNERRSQVILQAFEAMDKDKSGAINSDDLKVFDLSYNRVLSFNLFFVENLGGLQRFLGYCVFVGLVGLLPLDM